MAVPYKLTPIKDLRVGAVVNILGVLAEVRESFRSKGGDFVLDFTIQDEFGETSVGRESSVRCRVFRREKELLPNIGAIGDIILINDIRITSWQGHTNAVSGAKETTPVISFPFSKIPLHGPSEIDGSEARMHLDCIASHQDRLPSGQYELAVIRLKASAQPFIGHLGQDTSDNSPFVAARDNYATTPARTGRRDKWALIKDLVEYNYYNLVVEVVKIYSAEGGTVDLYVTDYTTNESLFLWEDPDLADEYTYKPTSKWQGPYGQVTMEVRLWEPHMSYVREHVRVGDLVIMTNVHAKISGANKLEGALHQDQRYPDKVLITKVTNEHQEEEHKARRRAYREKWNAEKAKALNAFDKMDMGPKKPSAKDSAKRKESKIQAKKEQQRLKKQQEQQQLEKVAREKEVAQSGVNPHVIASFPDMKLSSVDEILNNPARKANAKGGGYSLPFINAKYRTRLRVVDFAPSNLLEFVRSNRDPAWNTDLAHEPLPQKEKWEWGFVLLVEAGDATADSSASRFPLFVFNDTGHSLLGMKAKELRQDTEGRALRQAEEKLFILWGNLLELKKDLGKEGVKFPLPAGDKRLQNMPFECCVHEYGCQVPRSKLWPLGWQRSFTLAMTVIRD